jgi:hypothetical protein
MIVKTQAPIETFKITYEQLQELQTFLEQKKEDNMAEKENLLLSLLKDRFEKLPEVDVKDIKIKRCFTYQDWTEKRDSCKKLLNILQSEQYLGYTIKQQIAFWVEAGIIEYPDVHFKDFNGMIHEYPASEGLKIKRKVYELMRENNTYFQNTKKPLSIPSEDLIEYFLDEIKNKNYQAGLLKRDLIEQILKGENIPEEKQPLVLSGQDLHVVLTFKDPKDSNYIYVWGMFTS